MQLTPVKSSNLKAIGHDPERDELHVEFHNGQRWIYAGVDAKKHAAMLAFPSVGKFFAASIRGQHEERRYEPPKEADEGEGE